MSNKLKRPMLASTLDEESLSKLKFPALASIKLDGIRALVIDSVVYSRSMKPIPNSSVQKLFGKPEYNGFDGELIYGEPNAPDVYNRSMECMKKEPRNVEDFEDNIRFYVFDLHDLNAGYRDRLHSLAMRIGHFGDKHIWTVQHVDIDSIESLLKFEKLALSEGYEGVMVRSIDGGYKNGRSTPKQQWLGKLKRFQDSEAEILEIIPLKKTVDGFTINELGYRKTSTRKDTKQIMQTMGSIRVKDVKSGVEFEIGSGFTQEQRDDFWENQAAYLGQLVKYKYFEIGKEKPRFPIYQGFRSAEDL